MPRPDFTTFRVEDVLPLPDRGGELRIVLGPRNAGTRAGLMVVAAIEPGHRVREHYHPYSDEMVLLQHGRMLLTLDGDEHVVDEGRAFLIPRGARHRMTNIGRHLLQAVLSLGPLAPEPELGHVDTE